MSAKSVPTFFNTQRGAEILGVSPRHFRRIAKRLRILPTRFRAGGSLGGSRIRDIYTYDQIQQLVALYKGPEAVD